MSSGSNLEKVLTSGQFAVTAELGPPKNADAEVIRTKAKLLSDCADAVNITDCQTAIVRMSSIASSVVLMQEGLEPVTQMTCRDRNRIAIQSDLLGAAAMGLKNLLCLTGDHRERQQIPLQIRLSFGLFAWQKKLRPAPSLSRRKLCITSKSSLHG
jgi:methylenetetrahydrofolate reductase (NADPH)